MRQKEAARTIGKARKPSTWHWSRDGVSAACGQPANPGQRLGAEFAELGDCPGCLALWLASPEWEAIRREVMRHVDEHAEARGYPTNKESTR